MEYVKLLKTAFIFSGTIWFISFLQFGRIDFYGSLAALFSLLIGAIHDLGDNYMETTNQSALARYVFGIIVTPLMGFIFTASIFYVCIGEMKWYFWLIAALIGLLSSLHGANGLFGEMKKTRI